MLGLLLVILSCTYNEEFVWLQILNSLGIDMCVSSLVVLLTYLCIGETDDKKVSYNELMSIVQSVLSKDQLVSVMSPTQTFPASNEFDEVRHKTLLERFLNTSEDVFYGDRAVTMLRRLKYYLEISDTISQEKVQNVKEVVFLLADYRNDEMFSALANIRLLRERNRKEKSSSEDIDDDHDDHIVKERIDVLRTIYTLWKFSVAEGIEDKLNIRFQVYLYKDIPVMRLEKMDSCVVVSNMPTEGMEFTSLGLYDSDTPMCNRYKQYIRSVQERSFNLSDILGEGMIRHGHKYKDISSLKKSFFVHALMEIDPDSYGNHSEENIMKLFDKWYANVTPIVPVKRK